MCERRGGGDSDIAVDIVLQRFKMKGENKKEIFFFFKSISVCLGVQNPM